MPAAIAPRTPDARTDPRTEPVHETFEFSLDLGERYVQRVAFDVPGADQFTIDEPEPLGDSRGPNPARVLGAAVGGCLAASLAFCLRKSRVDLDGMRTTVRGSLVRNEHGRLRIGGLSVLLEPVLPGEQRDRLPRCLGVFEDYCVVTASIRPAIPVEVTVEPDFR